MHAIAGFYASAHDRKALRAVETTIEDFLELAGLHVERVTLNYSHSSVYSVKRCPNHVCFVAVSSSPEAKDNKTRYAGCKPLTNKAIGPIVMLGRHQMVAPLGSDDPNANNGVLTEAQEKRQNHTGMPFYSCIVSSLTQGVDIAPKESVVLLNFAGFDTSVEKLVVDGMSSTLSDPHLCSLKLSCITVSNQSFQSSLGDTRKTSNYVMRGSRNYMYDKWRDGKLPESILGIPPPAQPPANKDERPNVPKDRLKCLKIMNDKLVPPQSLLNEWKSTIWSEKLSELIKVDRAKYNPDCLVLNDTGERSLKRAASEPVTGEEPPAKVLHAETDNVLTKDKAGEEFGPLVEIDIPTGGATKLTLLVSANSTAQDEDTAKTGAFLVADKDFLIPPTLCLGGFGSGTWKLGTDATEAKKKEHFVWLMDRPDCKLMLSTEGDPLPGNAQLPPAATIGKYLAVLNHCGEVGFNIVGHTWKRTDQSYEVQPQTEEGVIYSFKKRGKEASLANWLGLFSETRLAKAKTLSYIVKAKYKTSDKLMIPNKKWCFPVQPIKVVKDKLLRIL